MILIKLTQEEICDAIIEFVTNKFPQVLAIYLYGSFGTEDETLKSDVDIALQFSLGFKKPWTSWEFWSHAQELSILINRDVDLVCLNFVSTVFSYEILSTGRIIFETNRDEINLIESYYESRYLRFHESRMDLLEDFLKEK